MPLHGYDLVIYTPLFCSPARASNRCFRPSACRARTARLVSGRDGETASFRRARAMLYVHCARGATRCLGSPEARELRISSGTGEWHLKRHVGRSLVHFQWALWRSHRCVKREGRSGLYIPSSEHLATAKEPALVDTDSGQSATFYSDLHLKS